MAKALRSVQAARFCQTYRLILRTLPTNQKDGRLRGVRHLSHHKDALYAKGSKLLYSGRPPAQERGAGAQPIQMKMVWLRLPLAAWLCLQIFATDRVLAPQRLAEICVDVDDPATGKLRAVRSSECPAGMQPYRGAGVNIFDVLWDACPEAMGKGTSYNDTLRALDDAQAAGVRYFRFFASLWEQKKRWSIENPTLFWQRFDRLMDDVEARGMYVIPSLGTEGWEKVYPERDNTLNELVRDAGSAPRQLAVAYFGELVARYANRSSVLAWELGNELNLRVNLPAPSCDATAPCFNTAEMAAYTSDLVAVIRAHDAARFDRPVSSGYAMPRPAAWHMEHCPYRGACPTSVDPAPGARFWSNDSEAQFSEMLLAQNAAVDIISVHYYVGDAGRCAYFGQDGAECEMLRPVEVAVAAADGTGKLLFLGEYANSSLHFNRTADRAFPDACLALQANMSGARGAARRGAFALSGLWAFECPSHPDMGCLWPEDTGFNATMGAIAAANARMAK